MPGYKLIEDSTKVIFECGCCLTAAASCECVLRWLLGASELWAPQCLHVMLQRLGTLIWELFMVSWKGAEPQVLHEGLEKPAAFYPADQRGLNQKSGNCCVLEEEAEDEQSWSLSWSLQGGGCAGRSFWADLGGGDTSLLGTEQGSPRCSLWSCHGMNQFPHARFSSSDTREVSEFPKFAPGR